MTRFITVSTFRDANHVEGMVVAWDQDGNCFRRSFTIPTLVPTSRTDHQIGNQLVHLACTVAKVIGLPGGRGPSNPPTHGFTVPYSNNGVTVFEFEFDGYPDPDPSDECW